MTDILQILRTQKDYSGEERILKYREYQSLLKGNHQDVFSHLVSTKDTLNAHYITVNLASLIAKKQADLMFLKPVIINFQDNQDDLRFKEIAFRNEFQRLCYKQSISASAMGGCFFRLRWGLLNKYNSRKDKSGKEMNNELIIEALNPEYVFPEIQNDRMISCTIKYIEPTPVISQNKIQTEEYFIEEHYEPGKYYKNVYRILQNRNGIEIALLDMPKEMSLPFHQLPVIYIPNALENGFYGISDFDDKLELMHEINNTLSRISSAVRRYTYPILVATEEWITRAKAQGSCFTSVRSPIEHIRANGEHVKIRVEDIGVTAAPRDKQGHFQDVFKFIEYHPDLNGIQTHLNECVHLFLKLTGISPALLESGDMLSGEALKLKLTNTLVMIGAKKSLWEEGLKNLASTALVMDNAYSRKNKKHSNLQGFEADNIRIDWGDTLGLFKENPLPEIIQKVSAGLMSRQTAISLLENINEEEAFREWNRIREEM